MSPEKPDADRHDAAAAQEHSDAVPGDGSIDVAQLLENVRQRTLLELYDGDGRPIFH